MNGSKPYYDKTRKRWRIQYTDLEGHPQVVYDKTEKGVVAKFHEIQVALNRRKYIKPNKDTIKVIMEDMIEDQRGDMKPNSYSRKLDTKNVILKEMNDIVNKKIQQVTSKQINEEFKKLKEVKKPNGEYKYSQSYMDKIFSLLREVFEQAVEDKKVGSEDNPFKTKKGVKKPKSNKKPKEIKIFSKSESTAFFKELDKGYDEYTDVFYFLAYSSTRPGEATALCTKHINLEEEKIHIEDNQSRNEQRKSNYWFY